MKVVFKETRFAVNEEKGIVSCIITAYLNPSSQQQAIFTDYRMEKGFTVCGCAKCHPDDKFSLQIGQRIAESRAKKLIYQKGKEKAEKLFYYTKILQDDASKLIYDLENYKKKEDEHIELVAKSAEPK